MDHEYRAGEAVRMSFMNLNSGIWMRRNHSHIQIIMRNQSCMVDFPGIRFAGWTRYIFNKAWRKQRCHG